MPRVIRVIHEYYDNRIVRGLYAQVADNGNKLRILPGSAVINEQLITVNNPVEFAASSFIINNNELKRTDIVVLNALGNVEIIHGTSGEVAAPVCPALSVLLAQVSIPAGWKNFVGTGAFDEVLSIRSQHVIDTRFTPL
jgi:hypothetical protein